MNPGKRTLKLRQGARDEGEEERNLDSHRKKEEGNGHVIITEDVGVKQHERMSTPGSP